MKYNKTKIYSKILCKTSAEDKFGICDDLLQINL